MPPPTASQPVTDNACALVVLSDDQIAGRDESSGGFPDACYLALW